MLTINTSIWSLLTASIARQKSFIYLSRVFESTATCLSLKKEFKVSLKSVAKGSLPITKRSVLSGQTLRSEHASLPVRTKINFFSCHLLASPIPINEFPAWWIRQKAGTDGLHRLTKKIFFFLKYHVNWENTEMRPVGDWKSHDSSWSLSAY